MTNDTLPKKLTGEVALVCGALRATGAATVRRCLAQTAEGAEIRGYPRPFVVMPSGKSPPPSV